MTGSSWRGLLQSDGGRAVGVKLHEGRRGAEHSQKALRNTLDLLLKE
jgi:hypothetical protein